MNRFLSGIKNFMQEEEGLTTVEYAVAGAMVSAAVVLVFDDLGNIVCQVIDYLGNQLATTPAATDPGTGSC